MKQKKPAKLKKLKMYEYINIQQSFYQKNSDTKFLFDGRSFEVIKKIIVLNFIGQEKATENKIYKEVQNFSLY